MAARTVSAALAAEAAPSAEAARAAALEAQAAAAVRDAAAAVGLLRRELEAMKPSALRARARAGGATAAQLVAAADSPQLKPALVDLVLQIHHGAAAVRLEQFRTWAELI
jgi:hypothetical protein